MSVLTEGLLRARWKKDKPTKIFVEEGTKVTPSAREFLNEKQIELVVGKASEQVLPEEAPAPTPAPPREEKRYPYRLYDSGALLEEKPEDMTAIFGNQLVFKDHPRIEFRGKMDSLESEVLYTIGLFRDSEDTETLRGLRELYEYLRLALRAEVLNENLPDFTLLNYTADEIRSFTHHPKETFSMDHLRLTGEEPLEVLAINRLRTQVRELEVLATKVFRREKSVEREDLIKGLNRLSSGFYYLMFKAMSFEKNRRR